MNKRGQINQIHVLNGALWYKGQVHCRISDMDLLFQKQACPSPGMNWGLHAQIAKFMWPTWVPPGSCRPQAGPMLASRTLLLGWYLAHIAMEVNPRLAKPQLRFSGGLDKFGLISFENRPLLIRVVSVIGEYLFHFAGKSRGIGVGWTPASIRTLLCSISKLIFASISVSKCYFPSALLSIFLLKVDAKLFWTKSIWRANISTESISTIFYGFCWLRIEVVLLQRLWMLLTCDFIELSLESLYFKSYWNYSFFYKWWNKVQNVVKLLFDAFPH